MSIRIIPYEKNKDVATNTSGKKVETYKEKINIRGVGYVTIKNSMVFTHLIFDFAQRA